MAPLANHILGHPSCHTPAPSTHEWCPDVSGPDFFPRYLSSNCLQNIVMSWERSLLPLTLTLCVNNVLIDAQHWLLQTTQLHNHDRTNILFKTSPQTMRTNYKQNVWSNMKKDWPSTDHHLRVAGKSGGQIVWPNLTVNCLNICTNWSSIN